MHPTTNELLALRDGEAAPEVARHVTDCAPCSTELERLRAVQEAMRELPAVALPNEGWVLLRSKLNRSRRVDRWRRGLMVAAAVIIIGFLGALAIHQVSRRSGPPTLVEIPDDQALTELITASRQLESVLQVPALQSPVLSPPEAARIVWLEDRIAIVDLQLAVTTSRPNPDHEVALWSDRVELLDEIVRARAGFSPTSGVQRAVFTEERR